MTTRAEHARSRRPRRPLLRSFRFWVPVGIVLLLIALAIVAAIVGTRLYDRAMAAKDSLEQAMPLATTVKDQILASDAEGATATAARLAELTADAREQTDDDMWKSFEWVPVVGPNLYAIRTAAIVTDDLVNDALTPATSLSINALTPVDGAINLEAITGMQAAVSQASNAVNTASTTLSSVDRDGLIAEVDGALTKLTDAVDKMQPLLGPANDIIAVLPKALGADGPRNYLLIFQNNAESRGTGGNPAALVMLTADQGRLSITRQASTADFDNGRPNPITELNPETVAIYGDKIGRYIQDTTLAPDFTETAAIVRAFWADSFGTPIDAVMSFDPVALSYLLQATGPVTVSPAPIEFDGRTVSIVDNPVALNADDAVPFLLNQVYSQIPEPELQDAFFAAAAGAIFDAVVSGTGDPKALLTSITRAVDENRLMYVPSDTAEDELIGETRLSGRMPSTNDVESLLGVFVNDITEGKLDYYMQLDIAAASTQCEADAPVFTSSATLTNTLAAADVPGLAKYISPARFFPKGVVSTDLVLYGPVGSTLTSISVDGTEVAATALTYMGRPALRVNVQNAPGITHTVTATFSAPEGEYGPLSVRHTPMVRDTPVTLDTPGCK